MMKVAFGADSERVATTDQSKFQAALQNTTVESLMQMYQQADEGAAAELIRRISPQVFRYFLGQARERSRAEDLLQDFWLRIHHARQTYRVGEPVLPWIFAIARRVQTDDYRRRSRIARHEMQSETLPDLPATAYSRNDLPSVNELLAQLPATQRETVLMLKVAGLSLEEVARSTGSSVGAVKQKAHRAYVSLRRLFGSENEL